jgi:hypothetical protein
MVGNMEVINHARKAGILMIIDIIWFRMRGMRGNSAMAIVTTIINGTMEYNIGSAS